MMIGLDNATKRLLPEKKRESDLLWRRPRQASIGKARSPAQEKNFPTPVRKTKSHELQSEASLRCDRGKKKGEEGSTLLRPSGE